MHFTKTFLCLVVSWVFLAQEVVANPRTGFVTLINATPFDWKLASSHSYQVEWNFPSVVKAGTSHEQNIKFKKDHHDDGAEAYYTLVNSPSPASFIVKARAPKHIEVQFQDTLNSFNNPENSIINLGFARNGAVSFVLSGSGDGPYISSNPPVAWMQSTLSSIGSKSLREISMPASHDSGMSEVSYSWSGVPHNTQTQTVNTFKQLVHGARIFDIRPTYYHGKFYAGHFSRMGSSMVGGTGRRISDIVKDVNAFTNQYPGELIILDISHQMDADKEFRNLSPAKWTKLYEELNKIQALWVPSTSDSPHDLSTLPLSAFITPESRSAVLVRLPNDAPLPESGLKSRLLRKRNVAAIATYSSDARVDPGDGMTALGPALEGDDNDNSTTADDGTTEPAPASALSSDDDDDHSTASDDNTDSPDSYSPIDSSPVSMTLSSVPTELPTVDPRPEPMPAEVPVQMGTSSMALFRESRLPITGSYADTDKSTRLTTDQLSKLASDRPNPHAAIHKSTWTITQRWQHITDAGNAKTSIVADSVAAHRALFGKLWSAMTRDSYPNMIEVDGIHNSQITALCMAINDYFASPHISSRSTRGFIERSVNTAVTSMHATAANFTKSEPSGGLAQLFGYGKSEVLRLSDSGCDEIAIVFKNRKVCWDMMTPKEMKFGKKRKSELEEKYMKEEEKKESNERGNVEKELKKLNEGRKKVGLPELLLINSTIVDPAKGNKARPDCSKIHLAQDNLTEVNLTVANDVNQRGIRFKA